MIAVRDGDLDDPQVIALLRRHLQGMHEHSPPESVHALDLSGLKRADVSFYTAWEGDVLLGCGALKSLGDGQGEIKSMRTADAALRRGVGAAILSHILAVARARGLERLSLETGSGAAFEPATAMYRRFGFEDCGAFGDYPKDDPFSRFMTISI